MSFRTAQSSDIIRYAQSFDKYYKDMMDEKGLAYELVCEFTFKVLMSRQSPLAKLSGLTTDDLQRHTEIAHADPYVPSIPLSEVKKEELPDVSAGEYSFTSGQASLNCFAKIPTHLCGCRRCPKTCSTDTVL